MPMLSERSVLGAILIDGAKFPVVRQLISAEDFYDPRHRKVFETMELVFQKGEVINLVSVSSRVSKDIKKVFLAELTEETFTSSFAEQDAKIVKEKSLARQITVFGKVITASGEAGNLDDAEEKMLESLKRINESKIKKDRSLKDLIFNVLNEEAEGRLRGVDTGIRQIDEMTIGLKPGHFWVIGAQYKTGKTLMVLEIARRVAKTEKVFFYTLEMSDDELVSRLLWMERNEGKDKNQAMDNVAKLDGNLSIFSDKFSLSQIEAHLLAQENKPKVVIIDYIGLVSTSDKTTFERISNVSRSFKNLARRAGVCIIALSQINNDSINHDTKTVGYKGSGDVAADVDVGIVLTRDFEKNTDHVPFICDIRLNRHGRSGKIDLEFDRIAGRIIF